MGNDKDDAIARAHAALELEQEEKDVNAAIKQLLSEMEVAARTPPVEACHPYECERRRKLVIRAVWALYKRVRKNADGTA